jgi:hypothetical protein
MKKFSDKVHRLSQRAAEIKHAIESVPPKIAEIRDAAIAATGQVQKLRADILSGVSTLRAETDTQFITALREIDSAAEVFHEAGCELAGIDLDLGPARKIRVTLKWDDDIDANRVRALHQANATQPTVAAILAALLKADELSENVELEQLRHATITVEIGLVPSVRIGWRAKSETNELASGAFAAVVAAPMPATPPPTEFKSSSYFEHHDSAAAAKPAPETRTESSPSSTLAPHAVTTAAAAQPNNRAKWQASALDRFKKMPDVS